MICILILLTRLGIPQVRASIDDVDKMERLSDSIRHYRNLEIHAYKAYIDSLERFALEEGEMYYQVFALTERSFYHIIKTEYHQALTLLSKANFLAIEHQVDSLLLDIHTFTGIAHIELFDYFAAIETYKAGIEIAQLRGRNEDILGGYHMIGDIYRRCKEYDKALENFLKGSPPENAPVVERHGWWNLNIGALYHELGELETALSHYLAALEIWKGMNMVRGMGYTNNSLGDLYFDMGQSECADFFEKAITYNQMMGNTAQIITAHLGLGNYYEQIADKNVNAHQHFMKAYQLGTRNNLEYLLVPACDFLIKNYTQHDYTTLPISELLETKTRSIEASLKRSSNVELKISAAREKVHLTEQREKFTSQKLVLATKLNIVLLLLILSFVLFSVFILFQFNQLRKSKKQINEQFQMIVAQANVLEKANQQLTENKISLEEDLTINTFALEHSKKLVSKLKEITNEGDPKKVQMVIRSQLDETYWEELNTINSFKDQSFIQKLSYMHPKLNMNEITICCMLKNGLTSKEIGQILYRSTASIKVTRSRIRKKMNLKTGEDLSLYLNNIEY